MRKNRLAKIIKFRFQMQTDNADKYRQTCIKLDSVFFRYLCKSITFHLWLVPPPLWLILMFDKLFKTKNSITLSETGSWNKIIYNQLSFKAKRFFIQKYTCRYLLKHLFKKDWFWTYFNKFPLCISQIFSMSNLCPFLSFSMR